MPTPVTTAPPIACAPSVGASTRSVDSIGVRNFPPHRRYEQSIGEYSRFSSKPRCLPLIADALVTTPEQERDQRTSRCFLRSVLLPQRRGDPRLARLRPRARAAERAKALGDPTRLAVALALRKGGSSASVTSPGFPAGPRTSSPTTCACCAGPGWRAHVATARWSSTRSPARARAARAADRVVRGPGLGVTDPALALIPAPSLERGAPRLPSLAPAERDGLTRPASAPSPG